MNNNNNRKDVKDRILEAAEKIEKCISILESTTTKHPDPIADIVKFSVKYYLRNKTGSNKPS